jgi:hypothetical protein
VVPLFAGAKELPEPLPRAQLTLPRAFDPQLAAVSGSFVRHELEGRSQVSTLGGEREHRAGMIVSMVRLRIRSFPKSCHGVLL